MLSDQHSKPIEMLENPKAVCRTTQEVIPNVIMMKVRKKHTDVIWLNPK